MIGHKTESQDLYIIPLGRNANKREHNKKVADRIEKQRTIDCVLVTMVDNARHKWPGRVFHSHTAKVINILLNINGTS
jgi:hypothetical protein